MASVLIRTPKSIRHRALQKKMQSVPITTNVVSSNPDHSEVYSIQHYLIKFVSELRKAAVFSGFSSVSSINKTDLMGYNIYRLPYTCI